VTIELQAPGLALAHASITEFEIPGSDEARATTFDQAGLPRASFYWRAPCLSQRAFAAYAEATSREPSSSIAETRPSTDWVAYSSPYVGPDEVVMLAPTGRYFVTLKVTAVKPGLVTAVDP
jgi:hypothetical protein